MTTLKICPSDKFREAAHNAYADLRAGLKLLRRCRCIAGCRKLRRGYNRLGVALDTEKSK
jgi:hypothetical protein